MIAATKTIAHCFGRAWQLRRQFLPAHIALTLLATAVISPVVAFFLRLAVSLSGQPALTDQDIAFFIVSPLGFICMIFVVSVLITSGVVGTAVMMSIDMADRQGVKLRLWAALVFVVRRLPAVMVFAALLVIRVLLIAAPFLVVAGLVAWQLLTKYDINYYLSARPPEFITAVIVGGVIAAILGGILLNRLATWSLALPGLLFSGFAPAAAFRRSAELTAKSKRSILTLISIWALVSMGIGIVVFAMLGLLADTVVQPLSGGSLLQLILLIFTLLLIFYIANMMTTALTAGSLSILLSEQLEAAGVPAAARFDSARPGVLASGHTPRAPIAFFIIAVIASTGSGLALLHDVQAVDSVEIIAHRGAAGARPENTMASVRKAIEDGADWIEIDVQETADGEVIVMHDSDYMKLAGVDLKVWDATMDKLSEIDIGSWFGPDYAGERTPTLRAVLEEAKGKAKVLIELKYYGHDQRLEERVVEIVEATDMVENIAVMSLKYPAIQKIKALRPDWRVGLLAATAVGDLTKLEADFLAVSAGMASPDLIDAARDADRDLYVWTVNDPLAMSHMISRGVAGLITDEPALARKVLAERSEMSTPQRLLLRTADLFDIEMNTKSYRDTSP